MIQYLDIHMTDEKIFGCNLDVVLVFFYKILHITHMMHRHEQRKIIFPNSTLFWSLSIPIWVVIDAFWYFFTWGGIYLVNKKISLTSGLATLTLGGYPSSIKLCFWYINAFYLINELTRRRGISYTDICSYPSTNNGIFIACF